VLSSPRSRARRRGRPRATGLGVGRAGLAGPDRRPACLHRHRRLLTPGPDDMSGLHRNACPADRRRDHRARAGPSRPRDRRSGSRRFYLALCCIRPVRWASETPSLPPASAWCSAGPAGRYSLPAPLLGLRWPPSTAACKWLGTRQHGQASCRSGRSSCSARLWPSRSYLRCRIPVFVPCPQSRCHVNAM
jgi:hypothetical protein